MEDALIYFAKLSFISGVAGLFRCLHNGDYQGISNCIAVFVVSGLLGASLVALVASDFRGPEFGHLRHIGYAGIIGLLGKEGLIILDASSKTIIGKFISGPKPD